MDNGIAVMLDCAENGIVVIMGYADNDITVRLDYANNEIHNDCRVVLEIFKLLSLF